MKKVIRKKSKVAMEQVEHWSHECDRSNGPISIRIDRACPCCGMKKDGSTVGHSGGAFK